MKGVKEGQHATLRVEDREYMARVEDIRERHVVLGLSRVPDEPFVEGAEATLETVDFRGLHRLTGRLDPDRVQPDVVLLRWEDAEDIQRRQFVRVEAPCIVDVRRQGREPISTYTVNVSGSGFLLAGPDDLAVGEQVVLTVKLGGDEEDVLEATCEVVRITGNGHRGVHIIDIEEPDRERLVHYVFERQRSAPRVRLQ
ncbi:MAG: flagellar brake protein [Gaiellaceae bacterium]